jgi:hypothetical protein
VRTMTRDLLDLTREAAERGYSSSEAVAGYVASEWAEQDLRGC